MKKLAKMASLDNLRDVTEDEAQVRIWQYIFGYVEMAVVKCAIELGIADAIDANSGPMTLPQLSAAVRCPHPSLHRIMRFLVRHRIVKQTITSSYDQTPLSRRLMRSGPHSMAALILLESSPPMLGPWHYLSRRVREAGPTPFEAANGEEVWRYAEANPGHSKLINEAMACDARVAVEAVLEGCPEVFEGVGTVVDVGGGDGTAVSMVVKGCPWIRGINFDQPHVVSEAPEREGVVHVGGDMFHKVPSTDAAFLMWVLHDWGDEECIQILKKCREAIVENKGEGGGGKVIIVEAVIEEDGEDSENKLGNVGLMVDMVMMAHTNNGKERTLKEWEHVLINSGFSQFSVKTIPAVQSVIVALP